MAVLRNFWMKLVSLGFHLLYHQLAPTYDLVSWVVSFGQWRSWQLAAFPFLLGTDILELAHGPGHMLMALRQTGYKVTGSDLSPQMGQLALQKLKGIETPVDVVQAPAQRLPLAPASFDSVLSTFPTEFIAEQATLQEVSRVLRNGGRFVVVPQAQLTGESLPVRLLEFLYLITGQRNVPGKSDRDHQKYSHFQGFLEQIKSAGFDITIEEVVQRGSKITILVATKKMGQD